jgi:hypothetical protein
LLSVLDIIESYIEVAAQLQAIGPEIVNKMVCCFSFFTTLRSLPWLNSLLMLLQVEILTLFNSRTCQLLLGAGATHLGLKGQRVR